MPFSEPNLFENIVGGLYHCTYCGGYYDRRPDGNRSVVLTTEVSCNHSGDDKLAPLTDADGNIHFHRGKPNEG